MINLSTSSDELWRVLPEEHDKAIYWMKKHFGGELRYEKMRDELLRRCVNAERPLASEMVDYISKEGNHWVCYEQATYYPESNGSHCMPYAACYYETAVSLGLFVVGFAQGYTKDSPRSIFIYTPHFFQRYCERMGVSGTPRETLMHFMAQSPSMAVTFMPLDEDGRKRVVVRLPGCICPGIAREDGKNVFEVRTILNDEQLSSKQTRETEKARGLGDLVKFEPKDLRRERLLRSGNTIRSVMEEVERYRSMGIDTSQLENVINLNIILSETFVKMGLADKYDLDYWDKFGAQLALPVDNYIKKQEEEGEKFNCFNELVKIAKEMAKKMGVRKFDYREFARIVLVDYWKLSETEASDVLTYL